MIQPYGPLEPLPAIIVLLALVLGAGLALLVLKGLEWLLDDPTYKRFLELYKKDGYRSPAEEAEYQTLARRTVFGASQN